MANGNQKNVRVIGVLVLVIVVFVAWSSGLVAIEFEKDAPNKLPSTFGYLLLASLFVERAIEVFLSAWRSGEADAQDIQIKQTGPRSRRSKRLSPMGRPRRTRSGTNWTGSKITSRNSSRPGSCTRRIRVSSRSGSA